MDFGINQIHVDYNNMINIVIKILLCRCLSLSLSHTFTFTTVFLLSTAFALVVHSRSYSLAHFHSHILYIIDLATRKQCMMVTGLYARCCEKVIEKLYRIVT